MDTFWTRRRKKTKGKKKKHNERIIKDRIIRDIRTLFEQEDYYEHKRVSNFWDNNYIEYGLMVIKNRNLSFDEYLKIKPYLMNIIINLENYYAWKIQLTIAINFISSKDAGEERLIHSSSGNIKLKPYSDVNDIIDKHEVDCSRYQKKLEISIERSDFIFDLVQLMY